MGALTGFIRSILFGANGEPPDDAPDDEPERLVVAPPAGGRLLTLRGAIARYGNPGIDFEHPERDREDPAWRAAHLVVRQGPTAIPGIPPRWFLTLHRDVEPLFEAGLAAGFAAVDAATPAGQRPWRPRRAGGYNFRRIRHDTPARASARANRPPLRPYSLHAVGIALDLDSDLNAGYAPKRGEKLEPWSKAWRKRWPEGLPQAFVEAMERAGLVWGGRWASYRDPMHFQPAA